MEPHNYGIILSSDYFPRHTPILYQAGLFYACSDNTIEGHAGR